MTFFTKPNRRGSKQVSKRGNHALIKECSAGTADTAWSDSFQLDSSIDAFDVEAPTTEKRVSFRVNDDTGDMETTVFCYDNKVNNKTKKELFYSSSEFAENLREIRSTTDTASEDCPSIPFLLKHLRESARMIMKSQHDADREMLTSWSQSEGRGLEEFLCKEIQQKRAQANKRILKFQSTIKSSGNSDGERALAYRAIMESQSARTFAAVVAMGDALVASEYAASSIPRRSSKRRIMRRRSSQESMNSAKTEVAI